MIGKPEWSEFEKLEERCGGTARGWVLDEPRRLMVKLITRQELRIGTTVGGVWLGIGYGRRAYCLELTFMNGRSENGTWEYELVSSGTTWIVSGDTKNPIVDRIQPAWITLQD